MTTVYEVSVEYTYGQRQGGYHDVGGYFVDNSLPELLERLMLAHPEAHAIHVTDKGSAQ